MGDVTPPAAAERRLEERVRAVEGQPVAKAPVPVEDRDEQHSSVRLPSEEDVHRFRVSPMRTAQRVGDDVPVTAQFLFRSKDVTLLRLQIAEIAHLDALIVPEASGVDVKTLAHLFNPLGDACRRARAAYLALEERGDFVYIHQLWVQESFRGLGYGTVLMRHILGEYGMRFAEDPVFLLAANVACPFASKNDDERLCAYYERLGFTRLSAGTRLMYRSSFEKRREQEQQLREADNGIQRSECRAGGPYPEVSRHHG
jgi:GNAT superfamily N-acetyltransferase